MILKDKVTPKQLVTFLLADRYGKVSVTTGRGTGRGWKRITTDHSVPSEVKHLVETHLVNANMCGTWWPEMSSEPDACVNWSTN